MARSRFGHRAWSRPTSLPPSTHHGALMETADPTTLPGDGLNGQLSGPAKSLNHLPGHDFEPSPGTEASSWHCTGRREGHVLGSTKLLGYVWQYRRSQGRKATRLEWNSSVLWMSGRARGSACVTDTGHSRARARAPRLRSVDAAFYEAPCLQQ